MVAIAEIVSGTAIPDIAGWGFFSTGKRDCRELPPNPLVPELPRNTPRLVTSKKLAALRWVSPNQPAEARQKIV